MAFGDGQLQADQARQIAAHVESCSDCARAVAAAKLLSQQMANWQVENAPAALTQSVLAVLESRPRRMELKLVFGWWPKKRALVYAFAGAIFLLVTVVGTSLVLRYREGNLRDMRLTSYVVPEFEESLARLSRSPIEAEMPRREPTLEREFALEQDATLGKIIQDKSPSDSPSGPMIIRTVQLTLVTKSFETARTRIESIVQESKGYVDQMSVHSEPNSPKSLSAVVRIPDGKLASSLIELRKLGQPKEESQNSADVTAHYVDLVARLSNARNTEQRLLALLRDRTGNLKDVVAAEGEISRVREEIERMEAERKNFDNKVQYATVHVNLSEEYRAQLQESLPDTRTRINNAAIEGYESATDTILDIALTVLAIGPAVLVWLAFLSSIGFVAWRLVLLSLRRRSQTIVRI